ncbi:MAG: hypothetical protein HYT15_03405 [Candidatus Magasanikbacteria bacterium]|nr:hypothetical protein [Candidatus Magasanikbacteria bacterium]
MPAEEPSFSSTSISDDVETNIKPKKVVRKKRAKPAAPPPSANAKQTKISQQLTKIYQDERGHLPDMKKIKIKKSRSGFKTFLIVMFLGGLLAAAAWAGFFFMPSNKKFAEDKVELRVSGPTSVTAGTTTTYKIFYNNNQGLALKKATLNIQYPDGFVFSSSDIEAKNASHTEFDLGEIGIGKKKEISITGLTYGSLNQKQSWRVLLTYQPENFGSELQKASILDVVVDKSPFSLSINGSSKTLVGNVAEYAFVIKREAPSTIGKLELKPSWPKNFFITSSSPAMSKDFRWIIETNKKITPTSTPPDSWTFKITGRFSSSTSDGESSSADISGALLVTANNKTFNLSDSKLTPQLAENDLDFNLAINGSLSNFNVKPGDDLNMTITLKNQGDEDIKNAILKLGINTPAVKKLTLVDWSKIEDKYDGDIRGTQINDNLRRGEITWDKSKFPALANIAKGKEVTLDIKLPIKDASSFALSDLASSSQITALAEISFKDQKNAAQNLSSNQIVITVNSDLVFEARDNVSPVGSGEKHQLSWVLTNNFHALKNITLSADVYGDVTVDLPSSAPAGQATWSAQSKKITWTIAEMPESIDVLALPFTITLNKINPTQDLLVSKVHVQAEDTVTGATLDFMGEEIKLER